jgi:prepilin-type N-terminal cleavage/methylation domain-containing protein
MAAPPAPERAHPAHARGFGLVELLAVLAITGAVAGLAVPSLLRYWQVLSLQAGARELASTMNLGRQLAISRKTSVCVDLSGTSVRLRIGGCGGPFWTGPVTDAQGVIHISDPATLEISSNARVVFTALGAAIPSATYTVTHVRMQTSRAVVVAGSGRVSVE